jgi:archaellum component FlaC
MSETKVFVKIEDYKDVLDTIEVIKERLNDARNTLSKITEMKGKEDAELQGWDGKLSEIESKIEGLDSVLFEPGSM